MATAVRQNTESQHTISCKCEHIYNMQTLAPQKDSNERAENVDNHIIILSGH